VNQSSLLEEENPDLALGRRLRAHRIERAQSTRELAKMAGLSTAMINLIERGLATPSLRSLRQISEALDVPISSFFDDEAASEPDPEADLIVRRERRRQLRLSSTGVSKTLLSPNSPGSLEVMLVSLAPFGSSGTESYNHPGEEAGYVVRGTLKLWLDEKPHVLRPGDSFRFISTRPHRFENPGAEPTDVVWIVTPPFWGA
jgi:transcriptional regulator with XRE-family HTH domain